MTNSASAALSVAQAHARLRAHTDIQFSLPVAAKPPPPHPSPFLTWLVDPIAHALPFGGAVFWLLIAVALAGVVWLIIVVLARSREAPDAAEPTEEMAAWRPEEKVARALLAEADAMAAAGRYEEAARLLLHRSLEDIARRRPRFLRPAFTSREIARAAALPDLVRSAFAAMAAPVERSLFGGRRLAASDWEQARTAYGEFALPGAWT